MQLLPAESCMTKTHGNIGIQNYATENDIKATNNIETATTTQSQKKHCCNSCSCCLLQTKRQLNSFSFVNANKNKNDKWRTQISR